ncbi:MAG: hypothetical protein RSC48_09100, partial [Anaerorhabdus sp.]
MFPSIRFISQYPVFKVLASPFGGLRRAVSGVQRKEILYLPATLVSRTIFKVFKNSCGLVTAPCPFVAGEFLTRSKQLCYDTKETQPRKRRTKSSQLIFLTRARRPWHRVRNIDGGEMNIR